jgi:hypothetical protein
MKGKPLGPFCCLGHSNFGHLCLFRPVLARLNDTILNQSKYSNLIIWNLILGITGLGQGFRDSKFGFKYLVRLWT